MKNRPSTSLLSTMQRSSQLFPVPVMWIVYGLTFIFLGLTVVVSRVTGYSIAVMVRDPHFVLDGHPIIGVQSHVGVLIWFAGACICLFCAVFLSYARAQNRRLKTEVSPFLLGFGLITLWLALDDLFLIHEYLSEEILNISELPIYAVYAGVVLWQVVRFRRYIVQSRRTLPLLLCAIAFFTLSILSDIFLTGWDEFGRIFFEDGFKLLGIVSWSSYLIQHSFQSLTVGTVSKTQQTQ